MKLQLFILILLFPLKGICNDSVNEVVARLDEAIENREYFVGKKLSKINEIKEEHFKKGLNTNASDLFEYYKILSKEYQTFKFDSAFAYAGKLVEIANQLNNTDKICFAKTEFANILISAGIFNESLNTLKSIDISVASRPVKSFYYSVLSRGYFDMESFSQSQQFASIYRKNGMTCYDSAMNYMQKESWEYLSLNAQKKLKLGENDAAIEILNKLIYNYPLTNDQIAIQLMSLAFTHNILGDSEKALKYMAEASIADFRGAKKEAVALLFTANYLFERGDVIRASKYINVALEDSRFYGSNFRLWQVSQFLPFIKSKHIVTIEKQKQQLWIYAILVTFLSLVIIISLFIIFSQIKKLRKSKTLVETINKKLTASNEELLLSNKIKEEYVGYYFAVSSQIIEKLDKFKRSIRRKVNHKQYDELLLELENININREKLNLFNNFDKAFLNIFPEFIAKFNELLKKEEQIQPKEGQLLNNELRIFSLIRLGIHDTEKIARILDYSVNTIYAYKSKIKNKAKIPNNFEKDVMQIKRF